MGLPQRIQENEGTEAANQFSRKMPEAKTVVLTRDGVKYEVTIPNTMSEVDLSLRETFAEHYHREPTDQEMAELESLLARAVTE